MKVLFHRYGSIVEPDILAAFGKFGIEVIEDKMEITDKNIDSDTRLSVLMEQILTDRPEFVFSVNYFPYISTVCEKLKTKYVALSVDCPVLEIYSETIRNSCNRVFLFDYSQYESVVNENPSGIFYMPLGTNTERWNEVLGEPSFEPGQKYAYDISFVGSLYTEKSVLRNIELPEFQKGYVDGLLRAQGLMNDLSVLENVFKAAGKAGGSESDAAEESDASRLIKSLGQSTPEFFAKNSLPDAFIDTKSFVTVQNLFGFELSAKDRIELLGAFSEAGLRTDIFTRSDVAASLKDEKTDFGNIIVHGGVRTHDEMPRIFRTSKINLNPTMRCIKTGLSQRVWDVLGCGGFLMMNYQAEIPEYFEIGEDLICYESISDAVEYAGYFLEHEEERLSIAKNGYEKVKKLHTYEVRVAQILKTVLEG